MSTITRNAGGASAYFHPHNRTTQAFNDHVAFSSDDHDVSRKEWLLVTDELLRIRNLKDDWDGEGTEAPHPALVDGAITLAEYLRGKGNSPPIRVHASVNSTVYFEWHTELGYREIEVVSPVEAESRFVCKGTDKTEVMFLYRQS
jgi:hypothetical protein